MEDLDHHFMGLALEEAAAAAAEREVPVGCVIVRAGEVIGRGRNHREAWQDPTSHAEVVAIRDAAQNISNWRLTETTLYVTLEPCLMCMGAIILARVERLVYGPTDPKGGAAGTLYDVSSDSRLNHMVEVRSGVRGEEATQQLKAFFRELRALKKATGRPQ